MNQVQEVRSEWKGSGTTILFYATRFYFYATRIDGFELAHRTKEDEQVGQRLMPALVLLKRIEFPERFRRRAALPEGTEPASPRAR